MPGRVYDLVRSLVESLGGTMTYERKDFRYGAWVITMGEKSKVFEAVGDQSFPELDKLFKPKVQHPQHWDDYFNELQADAKSRLLIIMGLSPVPENEIEGLTQLIDRAKWKFSWTLARTYPHEYTTKTLCDTVDHAKLIDYIERYGVVEHFGKYRSKYLYFGDRKFWHMGDPYSADLEQQPNVINRTWIDVRRHAQNVEHRWTAEEVELQKRIWEIQLEKKKRL